MFARVLAVIACLVTSGVQAQERLLAQAPLRIGVLTDETGPYADSAGPGSITAAEMAARDFGGTVRGRAIEIVHADTLNKPDVAAAIARKWFDNDGVSAIVDLPVTPVALAVQEIAKQKNRTVMITASAASEFTTKYCSPVSTHWADDTHALTTGTARALLAGGNDTWFFITVDMAFGLALERDATAIVTAGGGRVLGTARHPIGTTDYASLLLQAQASGAKVVALASVGGDLVNLLKQANEFGLRDRLRMPSSSARYARTASVQGCPPSLCPSAYARASTSLSSRASRTYRSGVRFTVTRSRCAGCPSAAGASAGGRPGVLPPTSPKMYTSSSPAPASAHDRPYARPKPSDNSRRSAVPFPCTSSGGSRSDGTRNSRAASTNRTRPPSRPSSRSRPSPASRRAW